VVFAWAARRTKDVLECTGARARHPDAQSAHPDVQAAHPNARAPEPNARARDPNAQARDPNAQARDPNAQARDPNAQARDQSAQARHPNAQARDPNAQARDQSARARHPNARAARPTHCFAGPSRPLSRLGAEVAILRDVPDASPLTSAQWRTLLDRALLKALDLKGGDEAAAEDLVQRAVEIVLRPGGPGHTERDPKLLLKAIRRQMWSLAGKDTQRFDPVGREGVELDDDRQQVPETNWRPGRIPNPQELLLAKEQHERGTARYAKVATRFKGDELASLLLDTSYEKDEAAAEALRRGYTEAQINDARKRLKRYLTTILQEERQS
jgi:hypothetical protein